MTSPTSDDTHDTILRFGQYYRRRYSVETNTICPIPPAEKILDAHDLAYYHRILHDHDISKAFDNYLDLDAEFYCGVRDQIESLLRAWDAILEEKLRYDEEGWPPMDREFMESFVLCLYMIPKQVRIGYLGAHAMRQGADKDPRWEPLLTDEGSSHESISGASRVEPNHHSHLGSKGSSGLGHHDKAIPATALQCEDGQTAAVLSSIELEAPENPQTFPMDSEIFSISSDDSSGGEETWLQSQAPVWDADAYNIFEWSRNTAALDPQELRLGSMNYPYDAFDENDLSRYLSLDPLLDQTEKAITRHETPSSVPHNTHAMPGDSSRTGSGMGPASMAEAEGSRQGFLVPKKRKYSEVGDLKECGAEGPLAKQRESKKPKLTLSMQPLIQKEK